jgi:hypothetical protein
MTSGFGNLLIDAKVLFSSAADDLMHKRFATYPSHLKELNRIIRKSNELGIDDIAIVDEVPDNEKSAVGFIGTDAERAKLSEIVRESKKLVEKIQWNLKGQATKNEASSIANLNNLFDRFHKVVKQLKSRHDNRQTIEIEDEYDVQDLLRALLNLHFDDIRPEEPTPSCAGKAARMDFLLKKDKIVIETKKTRKGLAAKELGDEILADIGRYSEHQECKTLICFIYDPEERVVNPRGLEHDLMSKSSDSLKVIVAIRPIHR